MDAVGRWGGGRSSTASTERALGGVWGGGSGRLCALWKIGCSWELVVGWGSGQVVGDVDRRGAGGESERKAEGLSPHYEASRQKTPRPNSAPQHTALLGPLAAPPQPQSIPFSPSPCAPGLAAQSARVRVTDERRRRARGCHLVPRPARKAQAQPLRARRCGRDALKACRVGLRGAPQAAGAPLGRVQAVRLGCSRPTGPRLRAWWAPSDASSVGGPRRRRT